MRRCNLTVSLFNPFSLSIHSLFSSQILSQKMISWSNRLINAFSHGNRKRPLDLLIRLFFAVRSRSRSLWMTGLKGQVSLPLSFSIVFLPQFEQTFLLHFIFTCSTQSIQCSYSSEVCRTSSFLWWLIHLLIPPLLPFPSFLLSFHFCQSILARPAYFLFPCSFCILPFCPSASRSLPFSFHPFVHYPLASYPLLICPLHLSHRHFFIPSFILYKQPLTATQQQSTSLSASPSLFPLHWFSLSPFCLSFCPSVLSGLRPTLSILHSTHPVSLRCSILHSHSSPSFLFCLCWLTSFRFVCSVLSVN